MTRCFATGSVVLKGKVTGKEMTKAAPPRMVPANTKGRSSRTSATMIAGDGLASGPLARAIELKESIKRVIITMAIFRFIAVPPDTINF